MVHVRGERRPAGAGVGVDHLSEEDALPHGVTDIYYIYIRYAIAGVVDVNEDNW